MNNPSEKGLKRITCIDFGTPELSGSFVTCEYDEVSGIFFFKTPKRIRSDPLQ